jgi:hypothetical protein
MRDPARELQWRSEDAEHNYALCRDLLTVPADVLSAQIAALLSPTADESGAPVQVRPVDGARP